MKCARQVRFLLTGALLAGLLAVSSAGLADGPAAATSADRIRVDEPVIVTGAQVPDLLGAPVGELFAFAFFSGVAQPVVIQIDERASSGLYVPAEDGLLDTNDEIVLLAGEAGEQQENPAITAGETVVLPAYEFMIRDPLEGGQGWVYLYRSTLLSGAGLDYVTYDGGSDRIASPGVYQIGFDALHGFRDEIFLGGNPTDLLDRDKLRVAGVVPLPFPLPDLAFDLNEEDLSLANVAVLDGPVRVTRVATLTLSGDGAQVINVMHAYPHLVMQPISVTLPAAEVQIELAQFLTDWNAQASGMVYADERVSPPVPVDGQPDAVPETPLSTWRQVSGAYGVWISILPVPADLAGAGKIMYRDQAAFDSQDRGDGLAYGESGLSFESPAVAGIALSGREYFYAPGSAVDPGRLAAQVDQPLSVTVSAWFSGRLYLPVVRK